jgi:hypothetical protein
MSGSLGPSSPQSEDEKYTPHWFTNGSTFVILASKWEHGDQSGFTPQVRFIIANGTDNERDKVKETIDAVDSEQMARMLAHDELYYIGQTGTTPSPD